MAGRSKTGKHPMGRKMYNKAKRAVAKTTKRKAKKQLDTFSLKARVGGTITPSQGLQVANYLYGVYRLLDANSVVGVTQLPEFIMYRNLYDRVRVNSMKITYTPKANILALNSAQADNNYTLTGDNMIHTVIDNDGAAPSNMARLARYPSYRKYSLLKKFSRSYSIKYPRSVWLDCQNIYEDTTLLKRLGLTGGLTVYAENVLEDSGELFNEPLYDALIEYNVVFQGRSEGSLTVNPDTGAVTVTPSVEGAYAVETKIAPRYNTVDDKRYDASGNLVSFTDTDAP